MASPYRIKRARTPTQIAAAKALDRDCFSSDVESAKWDRSVTWIVEHTPTAQIIGYACLRFVTHEKLAYLTRAGISGEHRGQGLQKRLIRVRLAYAKQRGYPAAITYTVRANSRSVNSLIACGFRYYEPPNAWAGREMLYWYRGKAKLR